MNEPTKKEIVFLTDDNEVFAEIIKAGIEKELGMQVILFPTGEKMLQFTDDNPNIIPTAIILDYYLDSGEPAAQNGGEILFKLKDPERRTNPYRKIPVIMLTASDEIQMAITLLKKGAADYILKDDACFDNLKKTLNNILNIRNYESEIRFYKNKADTYRKRLIYASVAMAVIILALFLLFY